ncbi:alanine racemase [Methylohalobius crimeensis]|uniref:alanine racemase n=1 Tax=Methylohalobius crimeensis TaxID=244365 RepID=UPI0003B5B982
MNAPTAPWVQLNWDALVANLQRVRALAPRAKVLAVIKANAYGHGLIRVAQTLHEADGFAVARVEEGIALRRAGILQRIAVLQGFGDREQLKAHQTYRLEPVIHSVHQIDLLEAEGESHQSLRVWLKLDTGMHRLGVDAAAFPSALARLQRRLGAKAVALMTHLARADELEVSDTGDQLALFDRMTYKLTLEKNIANSAAVLAWPESHRDWVRPGLMLYGVSPFPDRPGPQLNLTPVMTFKSRLIAVKFLSPGASVGYGATWTARRPSRLGLVAAGYGDGYPREVPSGTLVLIDGHRVPLVGRVSMDVLSVDITDFPQVGVGSEATLWGEGLPVEVIAQKAETIPYTLMCRVAARVPMIEVQANYGARENRL